MLVLYVQLYIKCRPENHSAQLSVLQLRQQQGKIENLPFKMDENSLVEPLVRFLVRFQSYRLQGIVVTVKNIFMD